MVKNEQTDLTVQNGKDLQSHQDYSNWVITGRRLYQTSPQHSEYNSEYEEVISVEGSPIVCIDCGSTDKPCWKPTNNTPSFHASPEGICIDCYKQYWKDNPEIKVHSDSEFYEEFWMMVSEGGAAEDWMSMADVYPDNLGSAKDKWNSWTVDQRKQYLRDCDIKISEDRLVDFDEANQIVRDYMTEDFEEYYEAGDPVEWSQFTKESQEKIVDTVGSSSDMFEKLHENGYHKFCRRDPDNDSVDEDEHIW